MSLHNIKKRVIRQRIQKEISYKRETFDAILWDILSNKQCRVKVLGSDTLLVANYPENIEQKAAWLKPGNAVKVLHTAGNRHVLEVIGHGCAIPNPIDGCALPMLPVVAAGEDAVLNSTGVTLPVGQEVVNDYTSGCMVYAFEIACMKVWIAVGILRRSGVISGYQTQQLTETNLHDLSSGAPIEEVGGTVSIGAASATLYRIDAIVIGLDDVVDCVAGTESANPVVPATPSGHLLLGTVLIPPNCTAIYAWQINKSFAPAVPASLISSLSDGDLAYAQHSTTITISVKDQYNNYYSAGCTIKGSIDSGTGSVDGGTESTRGIPPGSYQTTFTYYRNLESFTYTGDPDDPVEVSPVLSFTMLENPSLIVKAHVLLRDIDGNMLL